MNQVFTKIDFHTLKTQTGAMWQPHGSEGRTGASIRILCEQESPYFKSALVRFHAGSQAALHEHQGVEYIYVIEGEFEDEMGVHRSGELLLYPPGSRHAWKSEAGAVMYVVWTGATPRL